MRQLISRKAISDCPSPRVTAREYWPTGMIFRSAFFKSGKQMTSKEGSSNFSWVHSFATHSPDRPEVDGNSNLNFAIFSHLGRELASMLKWLHGFGHESKLTPISAPPSQCVGGCGVESGACTDRSNDSGRAGDCRAFLPGKLWMAVRIPTPK